ncbi:MAG: serine/threonine-protein kinase, partial [Planctomycetota bacterium]
GRNGEASLERFHREARALAKLNHDNIVRVHDVDTREETHYIVMEFVEGADLSSLVRDRGPLPPVAAAEHIRQTAIGLEHAHSNGLIHRDIKPANLLLDTKGTIKILDLGLALLQSEEDESITADPARTIGTVDYVSPEQALNSREIDHRTDLYSLGCTLHFLLTGSAPFCVGTSAQRLMAHQKQNPPDIDDARMRAGLPPVAPWLKNICRKLMAKSPNDRHSSAAVLAEEIAHYSMKNKDKRAVPRIETAQASLRSSIGDAKEGRRQSGHRLERRSTRVRAKRNTTRLLFGIGIVLCIVIASIPMLLSLNGPSGGEQRDRATQELSTPNASAESRLKAARPEGEESERTLLSGVDTQAGRFCVVGNNKTYHRHDCSILRSKHNLHEVGPTELEGLRGCGRCKP